MTKKIKEKIKEQPQKMIDKDGIKSIIVTGFFVVVFVCAFFGMDVKKNTPVQFVDKMLSGDIVETASSQAGKPREFITPLQQLVGGISDILIDSSKVKDVSLLTVNISKLGALKESYDKLKNDDAISNLLSGNGKDLDLMEKLIDSESSFVDKSIELYGFLLDNQESLSYGEDGDLEVSESIKSTFDSLLFDRSILKDKVNMTENLFQENN